MATTFYAREVKARFGIPCTEDCRGLWMAKGRSPRGLPLDELIDPDEVAAIQDALEMGRGNRLGRFWVDRSNRKVTMMVGTKNRTRKVYY